MSKKTVWVINQFAGTPESGWGERHYYFAKHWKKKEYNTIIISGSYNHLFVNQPKTTSKTFTLEKLEKNITFCWVKIPKYNGASIFKIINMWLFAIKILFLNKNLIKKPDIVIISSMPIFSVISSYLLAKRHGAKFLFEVRDLWPQTPIHLKGYKKWHPMIVIMAFFERFGFKKASKIISVLPNSSNYINAISKKPNKWTYIPNGIDEDLVGNESLSNAILKQIPKNKFIIGYAGTLGLANAMEYFINAAELMVSNKEIHFILVGDGYNKETYKKQTKNLKNITFIDKIKKSQVQSILKHFDVCYLSRYNSPLYNHGVSYNKYFDYMLAKKPILESSCFIKDQVELSGCGLIVEPENIIAIKKGILTLYNMSKDERNEMGLKGYNYVKKNHDISYLSNKYISLFKSDS